MKQIVKPRPHKILLALAELERSTATLSWQSYESLLLKISPCAFTRKEHGYFVLALTII